VTDGQLKEAHLMDFEEKEPFSSGARSIGARRSGLGSVRRRRRDIDMVAGGVGA
jgi:hypothetical protein